jgi:hypothetical protein
MELIIIALIAVEVVIVRFFRRWCFGLILLIEQEWIFCRLSSVTAQSFGICLLDPMKRRRRRLYIHEDLISASA